MDWIVRRGITGSIVVKYYLLCLFVRQSVDPGQQFTWEHSNLEVNKPKNRYANVIAYDHSRVILTPVDGERHEFKSFKMELPKKMGLFI